MFSNLTFNKTFDVNYNFEAIAAKYIRIIFNLIFFFITKTEKAKTITAGAQ